MKKIIIILIGIICLSGCNMHRGISYTEDTFNEAVQNNCELVDIEFNGEKHEYVFYKIHASDGGSLSHWEGCKYCKEGHE